MLWIPTIALITIGGIAFIALDRIYKGFKDHDPQNCTECRRNNE